MWQRPGVSQLAPEYRKSADEEAQRAPLPKPRSAPAIGVRQAAAIIGVACALGTVGGLYGPLGYGATLQALEALKGGRRAASDCRTEVVDVANRTIGEFASIAAPPAPIHTMTSVEQGRH